MQFTFFVLHSALDRTTREREKKFYSSQQKSGAQFILPSDAIETFCNSKMKHKIITDNKQQQNCCAVGAGDANFFSGHQFELGFQLILKK